MRSAEWSVKSGTSRGTGGRECSVAADEQAVAAGVTRSDGGRSRSWLAGAPTVAGTAGAEVAGLQHFGRSAWRAMGPEQPLAQQHPAPAAGGQFANTDPSPRQRRSAIRIAGRVRFSYKGAPSWLQRSRIRPARRGRNASPKDRRSPSEIVHLAHERAESHRADPENLAQFLQLWPPITSAARDSRGPPPPHDARCHDGPHAGYVRRRRDAR